MQLTRDVIGFCKKYLPDGKSSGDWWRCRVPWRSDATPSLGVSLTTGNWLDFSREGDKGDILELLARIQRRAVVDVVRELGG